MGAARLVREVHVGGGVLGLIPGLQVGGFGAGLRKVELVGMAAGGADWSGRLFRGEGVAGFVLRGAGWGAALLFGFGAFAGDGLAFPGGDRSGGWGGAGRAALLRPGGCLAVLLAEPLLGGHVILRTPLRLG